MQATYALTDGLQPTLADDADCDTLLKFKQQTCMNKHTPDDTKTLASQIKEKKKHTHNNYKLKMDKLTNDRLKTSRLHWGGTYLQWLFLNS